MVKGPFENLTKWQNYAHYILLAFGVYIWHALPWNEAVEQMYIANPISGFIWLTLWWALGLFIIDTIIHWVFYNLPKPYRWRD